MFKIFRKMTFIEKVVRHSAFGLLDREAVMELTYTRNFIVTL